MIKQSLSLGSACLLALLPAPALAKEKVAVSPEQVAELYLGIFVNEDLAKAARLNELLGPAVTGGDSINVTEVSKMSDTLAAQMSSSMLEGMPENIQAGLKGPFTRMTKAVLGAVKRSQCRATGTTMTDNESIKGQKIATVSYDCAVVDAVPGLVALQRSGSLPPKDGPPTAAAIDAIAQIFSTAPLARHATGTMRLYSNDDRTLWYTGSPEEPYGEVLQAVAGQIRELMEKS